MGTTYDDNVFATYAGEGGVPLSNLFRRLMFAIRTLAISRRNAQVFDSEAKITREEVKRIVIDATLWGWSNSWLDSYYHKLNIFE